MSKIDQAVSRYGCSNRTDLFIKLWETVPIKQARQRNKEYERQAASAERQRQNARQQNVARYNELIGQADSLYNSGKLQEAAAAYRQAGQIFPRITSYNVCYTKLLRLKLRLLPCRWFV